MLSTVNYTIQMLESGIINKYIFKSFITFVIIFNVTRRTTAVAPHRHITSIIYFSKLS